MEWSGRVLPRQRSKLGSGAKDKEHAVSQKIDTSTSGYVNLSQCVN